MGSARKRGTLWQLIPESIISTVVIFLTASLPFASAQNKVVNIMLLYEDPCTVESFDAAVEYVKNDPALGYSTGEIWRIQSNGTNQTTLITSLCEHIDVAYKKPAGQQPDIIVDFTRHGIPSEAVKLITKGMTIPTISGSFGQEGGIQNWNDLSGHAKNYLIQIAPPTDMLPQVVRSIIHKQNMTTAAFLFDNEYVLNNTNKSSWENMPELHIIAKLETSIKTLRKQLDHIVHTYKNHTYTFICEVFIGAVPNEISAVLGEASGPDMKDGPYFSDEFAWYSMSTEPGLPKCFGCQVNVSLVHLTPIFPKENNKRWDFLKSKGIFKTQKLMEMFYFDLTMSAIGTVAKMKMEGIWKAPPSRVCSETVGPSDDAYDVPLFDALKNSTISDNSLLGPYHLDSDKTVGKSFSNFQMSIHRLFYKKGEEEPVSVKQIGVWTTGFGGNELISEWDKEEAEWKSHKVVPYKYKVRTIG